MCTSLTWTTLVGRVEVRDCRPPESKMTRIWDTRFIVKGAWETSNAKCIKMILLWWHTETWSCRILLSFVVKTQDLATPKRDKTRPALWAVTAAAATAPPQASAGNALEVELWAWLQELLKQWYIFFAKFLRWKNSQKSRRTDAIAVRYEMTWCEIWYLKNEVWNTIYDMFYVLFEK